MLTDGDVGLTVPTLGAFLICTEMCGSGQRTGTQYTIREHRLILRVRLRAPTVSIGAAPGQYRHVPAFGLPQHHAPSDRSTHIGFRVGFQIQPDEASPELELFGGADIPHKRDEPWAEPGYGASDVRDGNLTSSVSISGTVDVNTTGTYTLTYTVSDAAGNEANATRIVRVADESADTDGDGFNDYLETSSGSDVNDAASTPFNYGLVAWYPFDGNASDMSGNGNDLTGSGNSFGEDRHGVIGKSCRLDQVYLSDTNASFSIDDNASFSYSLWVQMNSVPSAYPAAFGLRDSTGNWETLRIGTLHIQDQNKFAVDHLSTGTNGSHVVKAWANQTTQIGRWYQITLVSSLSEVKLFIDSSLHSQVPFQRDAAKNDQVAIYVGGDATWNLFDGSVDDIRIYDRALSTEEVGMLYHMEMPKLDLNDSNFQDAVNLWFSDERNATWTYGHISDWNVSAVTDMSWAFYGRTGFKEDISNWDTSSVTNMGQMFFESNDFNQDISDWDTSSVTSMNLMFSYSSFNQDISNWDTSSVTDMRTIFHYSSFNQDISDWNISAVQYFGGAFDDANLSDNLKGKIHETFSSNPNWPYNWSEFVSHAPTDLNSTDPLTMLEKQSTGAIVGRFEATKLSLVKPILNYDFTTDLGANASDGVTGSTVSVVGVTDLGTELGNGNPSPAYEARGWVGEFNAGRYFKFEVTNSGSFDLNISSIQFDAIRTSPGTGPTNYAIRSSFDSFSNNLKSGELSTSWNQIDSPLTNHFLSPSESVEFRIIGWGANNIPPQGGHFILDNIEVNGSFLNKPLTYHFVNGDNNNSLFTIDTNGTLKTATVFDYETNASSYTITVQAKDEYNATVEANFTITLTDLYEDTDGDGFRDSLEVSTGSDLNDPNSTPLHQGLVAWYPFDGNLSDQSGNNRELNASQLVFGTDRFGSANMALDIQEYGAFSRIENLQPDGLVNGYSIVSWLQFDGSRDQQQWFYLFSQGWEGYGETPVFRAQVQSGQLWFMTSSNWYNDSIKYTLPIEQWIHLAFTNDNSSASLYMDAQLIQTKTGENIPSSASNLPFNIGGSGVGYTWHGKIDEVRLYNRSLSATEVASVYNLEKPKIALNDSNFQDAVNLWFSDEQNAINTYGHISDWNVSAVTDMSQAFKDRTNYNIDIGRWDVSNVTNMWQMFIRASSFNQDISSWDLSSLASLSSTFEGATSFNQNISGWDVSSVTSFMQAFNGATSFNQPIGDWNTSSATNLQSMFSNASVFDQDIGNWDVSSVNKMSYLFHGATSFNQDISQWDVSNVSEMTGIFEDASSFNHDISSWDVSSVGTFWKAFRGATAFNQPIGIWDVSSVSSMADMFRYTSNFNADISSWDVSSATDMSAMFYGAHAFNQDIGNWDTSLVETMWLMFAGSSSFNQDISGWDLSSIGTTAHGANGVGGMFSNVSSLSDANKGNIHVYFSGQSTWNHNWSQFITPSLDLGLVAWYPFDGNASDVSGNGNHGTVHGASLGTDRHGQANRAYSFDGVDDYVRTHVLADSQELTFSSWVYVLEQIDSGWGDQMMLFDDSTADNGNDLQLLINSTSVRSRADKGGANLIIDQADLNIGAKWHHIAMNVSNAEGAIFLNGVLLKIESAQSGSNVGYHNSEGGTIGTWQYGGFHLHFHGSIDDIRIYDRALSAGGNSFAL